MGIGLVAGCTSGSEDGAGPSPSSSDQSANALIPLPPFAAPVFNDEGLFVLGGASSRSSEVGEVLTAFAEIKDRVGNIGRTPGSTLPLVEAQAMRAVIRPPRRALVRMLIGVLALEG